MGGGGFKPKNIRSLQEDQKLMYENSLMRQISFEIKQRMDDDEISFSKDYMDFEGNLNFNDEDDE